MPMSCLSSLYPIFSLSHIRKSSSFPSCTLVNRMTRNGRHQRLVNSAPPILGLTSFVPSFISLSFSASPDTGWPDCFNSGVMVLEPSEATFAGMVQLLNEGDGEGTFDGGDQG